jgi:hypothetical protein
MELAVLAEEKTRKTKTKKLIGNRFQVCGN